MVGSTSAVSTIRDGQSDQVFGCGRTPSAEHIRAVQETSGQILTYRNSYVAEKRKALDAWGAQIVDSYSKPRGGESFVPMERKRA